MDEFTKLEQLQEYEKFSFNKDSQQNDNHELSNRQFKFASNNLEVNKRYRFNSFENQNQLNERDMTILQCLMQNDFPNHTEDFLLKKRRKSSYYDNDNILEFSKKRKISFPLSEEKEIQQVSNDQLFNEQKEPINKIKQIKKTIISKQDQNIKNSTQPISTEKIKLNAKIIKVAAFWKSQTFFIPNVFRMVKPIVSSKEYVFEIQDLSMKEVLIQSNGQKIKDLQ